MTATPMLGTLARLMLAAVVALALLCAVALGAGAQMRSDEVAFVTQERGGGTDIFVLDMARLVTSRLTNNQFPKLPPVWSPDGQHIAFSGRAWRGLYDDGLYVMDADGRDVRRLVAGRADHLPAWSPDGSHLAFVGGGGGMYSVYVADMATEEIRRVASKPRNISTLSWSPDGTRLAFVVVLGADDGLWMVDASGQNERRLLDDVVFTPVWSPDSRQLAYTAPYSGNSEIYVLNTDTGTQLNLTQDPSYDILPVWSPDGGMLAFYSLSECNELSLYVVPTEGGKRRRLLENCALSLREPDIRPPAWSPDGAEIIVTSQDGTALNLYGVHAQTGAITRLTDFDATAKYPAWRPEGI